VVTKLNVAAGLGELMCSKYKAAARLFLSANIDHCDFPEVLNSASAFSNRYNWYKYNCLIVHLYAVATFARFYSV